jgi:putative alpha-1,2-mannosidase
MLYFFTNLLDNITHTHKNHPTTTHHSPLLLPTNSIKRSGVIQSHLTLAPYLRMSTPVPCLVRLCCPLLVATQMTTSLFARYPTELQAVSIKYGSSIQTNSHTALKLKQLTTSSTCKICKIYEKKKRKKTKQIKIYFQVHILFITVDWHEDLF